LKTGNAIFQTWLFSSKTNYYVITIDFRLHEDVIYYKIIAHLKEVFHKPNLNIIDTFVDQLYKFPDNYQNLCKQYNFELVAKLPDNDAKKDNIVLWARYSSSTNIYTFCLNENALDLVDANLKKDEFKIEMKRAFVHENTHFQQNKGNFSKQKYKSPDAPTVSSFDYVTQWSEIPAWAREVAGYLEQKGFTQKNVIYYLELGNLDLLDTGMQDLIFFMKMSTPVWHKFLGEVYRYFEEV